MNKEELENLIVEIEDSDYFDEAFEMDGKVSFQFSFSDNDEMDEYFYECLDPVKELTTGFGLDAEDVSFEDNEDDSSLVVMSPIPQETYNKYTLNKV